MFCSGIRMCPLSSMWATSSIVAVRRQHAFLVLAAEERDLDLLALVLAGVVLHGPLSLSPRMRRPRRRARDVAVCDARRPAPRHRDAVGVHERARSAPPCETTSTGSSGCARRDAHHGRDDALAHRRCVSPSSILAAVAAARAARAPLLDLRAREPLPGADVDLAQPGSTLDRQAEPARRSARRLGARLRSLA